MSALKNTAERKRAVCDSAQSISLLCHRPSSLCASRAILRRLSSPSRAPDIYVPLVLIYIVDLPGRHPLNAWVVFLHGLTLPRHQVFVYDFISLTYIIYNVNGFYFALNTKNIFFSFLSTYMNHIFD